MASTKKSSRTASDEALVKVISLDVFACCFVIFVGSYDNVRRKIRNVKNAETRKRLSRAFDRIADDSSSDSSIDGTCILIDGDVYIHIVKRDDATFVHELVHGTRFLVNHLEIHDKTDETRAYISGYVYRKFNEKETK